MSYRGSGGKRVRTSPNDAVGSPNRPRNSRRGSPLSSPSPSPYRSPSPSPLPSPSPYRSPSPSPCRSWSQRPPSYDDADDEHRSRSRGSEEIDGHGRPVWRPYSYSGAGEQGHGGEFSVRISDYDHLFTCRSCRRMLSSPVYQCPFAHVTCSTCHGQVGDNRCSCCGAANGYGRNRVVEAFLGSIGFSCRNQEYGCKTFLPHYEMREHERSCRHEPCFCPVPRCGFAGQTYALEVHLTGCHSWDMVNFRYGKSFQAPAQVSTIFHSKDDDELFHIDSFPEGRGTALSMICIRRDNACKQEFTYELKTPPENGGGRRHRLQMQSTVCNSSLRHGMGEGGKVFLLVPDDLPGTENGCVVEVCIRKVGHRCNSVDYMV